MIVVLILDVNPTPDEPGRAREAVQTELESEVERIVVDVPNASGTYSAHDIKVAGIGKDVREATQSFAQRKQYATQD